MLSFGLGLTSPLVGKRRGATPLPNILTNTDFNGGWPLVSTTLTPFAADSPEGVLTAAKLSDNADLTYHKTSQINARGPEALEYTFSILAKRFGADQRDILLGIESPPGTAQYVEACWDLGTGVLRFTETAGAWSGLAHSSQDLGDGWHRLALKGLSNTDLTEIQVNIYLAQFLGNDAAAAVVYGAGDGSSLLIVKPRLVQGDELIP